jgi:hypothetical protein
MKKLSFTMLASPMALMTAFAASAMPSAPHTSSANASQAAAATATGCQSRSNALPWGDLGVRTWTPANNQENEGTPANAGIRTGAAFSAKLIQAYGVDTKLSRRTAILEFPDGCRRQYQIASFSSDDLSYIATQSSQHPLPADTSTYATVVDLEGLVTQAQIDAGQVKKYETQHFNIMYGTATGNFSYRYVADQGSDWTTFVTNAGKTLEDSWLLSRSITGAPMPYASASTKKKINVYVCGTGMPFIPNGDNTDCGASASAAVYASSVYLQPGSTTITHEFGHTIQLYSGGFRNKAAAGPIWETGANWVSFTATPTIDNGIAYYYSNLENGPLWSNSRYAAYPFMSYLFEKDNTRQFLWSTWTGNLRDANGGSTEDWTETLVRLAQAAGIYKNGYQSFADDMGWYGARLATGDLFNQKTLLDLRNSVYAAKLFTPLATTATSGSYASPDTRPLLQWGTHIIPLNPTQTGATVTAAVTGGTPENAAAWRWAIVTLAADGTPRYSSLGSVSGQATGAAVSLTAEANTKMYLVVTATPYAYQSLGWQQEHEAVTGNKFPYTVSITGATPLTGSTASCNSQPDGVQGQNLNYNTNGNVNNPVACQ